MKKYKPRTLQIIALLHEGLGIKEIANKGYNLETVKYHAMRIRRPEKYKEFLENQQIRMKSVRGKNIHS